MCGIAGVVAWDEKYRVKREQLQRMADSLAHRGPDGEGFYLNFEDREITPDNPQCGFAFRRLAIIDPDPRSNQPFRIGDLALVFNGEIYNFRELRSEISNLRPDYQWRTQGDAEVLLMSYEVWREKCVEHLNGMFAFAVWDDREKSLFLARDRMGQKPLFVAYLASDGRSTDPENRWYISDEPQPRPVAVVFASELSAMLSSRMLPAKLNGDAVTPYLQLGYIPRRQTIYAGITRLEPGVTVVTTGTSCIENWYWPTADWPCEERGKPESEVAASRTQELVRAAVRRQLVSDVPLGCLLSGGIDSSVIAAAMREAVDAGQEVLTFTIAFDDARYDESDYAARVARHLGTTHHRFQVRPQVVEDLPKLVAVFGEPFADSSALPTHYLARETRQLVKVALGGDGGDELFGGYDRYRAMAIAGRLRRLTTPIPWKLAAPLVRRFPGSHPKSRAARAKRFLASVALSPAHRYSSYMRLFDGDTLQEIIPLEGLPSGRYESASTSGSTHNDHIYFSWGDPRYNFSGRLEDRISDPVRAALASDRLLYLPGDLLTKLDRCSMLNGLEVRSPFMDHELVQFAAGLTTDQLLKGGPKRMLREAFAKDLPDFVFKRAKMGFAVPIGEWFRGELRPMLRENLFASDSFGKQHFNMKVVERLVDEHETQRVDHSQRLYALLMLELWWRWHKSL